MNQHPSPSSHYQPLSENDVVYDVILNLSYSDDIDPMEEEDVLINEEGSLVTLMVEQTCYLIPKDDFEAQKAFDKLMVMDHDEPELGSSLRHFKSLIYATLEADQEWMRPILKHVKRQKKPGLWSLKSFRGPCLVYTISIIESAIRSYAKKVSSSSSVSASSSTSSTSSSMPKSAPTSSSSLLFKHPRDDGNFDTEEADTDEADTDADGDAVSEPVCKKSK